MSQRLDAQDERDRQAGNILDRHLEGAFKLEETVVLSLYFKNKGGEWLLVVKKEGEEGKVMVAFSTGETMASALRRFYHRLRDEGATWREDTPYTA